jgi:hypothetical protein
MTQAELKQVEAEDYVLDKERPLSSDNADQETLTSTDTL